MMAEKFENESDLLEALEGGGVKKIMWVCPVTGRAFDSAFPEKIEEHKARLLSQLRSSKEMEQRRIEKEREEEEKERYSDKGAFNTFKKLLPEAKTTEDVSAALEKAVRQTIRDPEEAERFTLKLQLAFGPSIKHYKDSAGCVIFSLNKGNGRALKKEHKDLVQFLFQKAEDLPEESGYYVRFIYSEGAEYLCLYVGTYNNNRASLWRRDMVHKARRVNQVVHLDARNLLKQADRFSRFDKEIQNCKRAAEEYAKARTALVDCNTALRIAYAEKILQESADRLV